MHGHSNVRCSGHIYLIFIKRQIYLGQQRIEELNEHNHFVIQRQPDVGFLRVRRRNRYKRKLQNVVSPLLCRPSPVTGSSKLYLEKLGIMSPHGTASQTKDFFCSHRWWWRQQTHRQRSRLITVHHIILSNFLCKFFCSSCTLLAFVHLEMYTGCFLVTSTGLCRQKKNPWP